MGQGERANFGYLVEIRHLPRQFQYSLFAIATSENNGRFDLYLSLAILCKISNAQSEMELPAVTDRMYLELAGYHRQIFCHL